MRGATVDGFRFFAAIAMLDKVHGVFVQQQVPIVVIWLVSSKAITGHTGIRCLPRTLLLLNLLLIRVRERYTTPINMLLFQWLASPTPLPVVSRFLLVFLVHASIACLPLHPSIRSGLVIMECSTTHF